METKQLVAEGTIMKQAPEGSEGWDETPGLALTWDELTWQDIQAIGMALAERHPEVSILSLKDEDLAVLAAELPGFAADAGPPDPFLVAAIASAWIHAVEGEDDSSPYEFLA
jgi:FeS assembly protein IscX